MPRPKYPPTDKNHMLVIDALQEIGVMKFVDQPRLRYKFKVRGQTLIALNTSRMPGQIDWLIFSETGWFLPVEVKERGKEKELTAGELEWCESVGVLIASNKDTVKYALLERLGE